MEKPLRQSQDKRGPPADLVYSVVLFAVAVVGIGTASVVTGTGVTSAEWPLAAFFFLFGLFTIMVGYPHPTFGHVSFDRVAQVSSLLVLGPVAAAMINGLASLVYPLHRLRKGHSVRQVVTAGLHNAGLMSLMILVCGLLYLQLGGMVPLTTIDWRSAGLIALMAVAMQVINDLGMRVYVRLRGMGTAGMFSWFQTAVEIGSVPAAVLLAIVFQRMEIAVTSILLFVMSLGMLALKEFADIRQRLEALVRERTRELREKTLELERQATRDKLTGLHNRRYADAFIDAQLELASRLERPLAIVLADVDHFKSINDRYSHHVGDAVLETLSRLLESHCRDTDMVARYGGEEFLICLPATEAAAAAMVGESIRQMVAEFDWSHLDPSLEVTLSIGVAQSASHMDRVAVLKTADINLYRAKRDGRDRVAV
ncbi:MAG: GGDEF domain-containing protein [Gammaproteobacteria bacterium]|jgi:diguanylate cyclase (GGDEF)-like protein